MLKDLSDEYLSLHTHKEDLFWQAKMGLAADAQQAQEDLARAEIALNRFLQSPERLKQLRDADASGSGSEAARRTLRGWIDMFAARVIEDPEARTLSEAIVEREAALEHARGSMNLGFVDPETCVFHRASSVRLLAALALATTLAATAQGQGQAPPAKNPFLKLVEPWPDAKTMRQRKVEAEALRLFASEAPVALTLTTDLKAVNKDRNPNSKKLYPARLTTTTENGAAHTVPVTLNARGHLRRMARICDHVPLKLTLPAGQMKGTVFQGQEAVKLVVQCRNNSDSEQHLLREYLAYRVMNTLTPRSFRARLARVTYQDPAGQPLGTRYGMLLEDADDVARRMDGRQVEFPRTAFANLHRETLDAMMLFQYLLGNTDFSIYALHNVVLVMTPDRLLYPVPYDFDISGLVDPPYAIPDKRLPIKDVSERLYRGPCRTVEQLAPSLAHFRAQRDRVLALPDTIADLNKDSREDSRKFLNSFYEAIENPKDLKKLFVDTCIDASSM